MLGCNKLRNQTLEATLQLTKSILLAFISFNRSRRDKRVCEVHVQFIAKPKGKRPFGRRKFRWKGNMIVGFKEIKKYIFNP